MNNQWKMVPVEPTKEMKRAGLAERHDDLSRSIYQAMLAAAPVPPAGDVEVQRWHPQKTPIGTVVKPHSEGGFVTLEDHRAIATRLNAEVQRLENERASAVERCHEFRTGYRGAQDELTKALELLVKCDQALDFVGVQDHFIDYDFTAAVRKELKSAIADQSAPAAKTCQQPQAHPARCGCEQE